MYWVKMIVWREKCVTLEKTGNIRRWKWVGILKDTERVQLERGQGNCHTPAAKQELVCRSSAAEDNVT